MSPKTFKHGIHPSYNKEFTAHKLIEKAALPKKVVILLQQHIGAPCQPLVKRGDVVEEGQKIGDASSFVAAPVHSSISGKVTAIDSHSSPLGGKVLSVTIEGDGNVKEWPDSAVGLELDTLTPETMRAAIKEAGIVGMGGAAFPTHVKLSPPKDKCIDSVILNGCECEPYLTSDHRLMLEYPEKVIWGMRAIMKTIHASEGYIAIERNKRDAIEVIERVAKDVYPELKVIPLETKYPQGAEKMLIKATINRKVPIGKLPLDVGVVVNNVGTSIAIYDALKDGKPLIERVVTLSGRGLHEPKNLMVRIGTGFQELLDQCGGLVEGKDKEVLNGGPMMGISQMNLDAPVIKGTSGITVLLEDEFKKEAHKPCIRCASCVDACPMNLMPYRLGDLGRMAIVDTFKGWGGLSCIECGCCSFVCPSWRPLVQWIRIGKIRLRESERKGSE